ncbi:MAG: NADH-dependent [FeFe] hydrogenase, group A6, partial [Clostridia bacterium]
VMDSRKTTLELMLSDHKIDCLSCARNQNCELQTLALEYGCDSAKFNGAVNECEVDNSTEYLVRDNNKCILCGRCVAVCSSVQGVAVIGNNERGFETHVGSVFEQKLVNVSCVGCGQCINVCPTGALTEKSEIDNVIKAIDDSNKIVVVAAAPAVRVALGEEFGNPIGTDVEGKMATALRYLGFNYVFDIDFGADLTIMEEGYELLDRLKNGGKLPMITSCSPGWIKYCEHNYNDLLEHLSSCKSPQQMFGATVKTYFAEKIGVDPKNIYMVSVMPCVAKKFEKTRDNQNASGYPDVDAVLTTRELAKLIKRKGVNFNELPNGEFDAPMGIFTGAGVIFGATGGVMEAALRTVADVLTGEDLKDVEYKAVRGVKGIKTATYDIAGAKVKVAVASGLTNAKTIMDSIRDGKCDFQFVEIMCCPGGCVNGGGQPIHNMATRESVDIPKLRAKALYKLDATKVRKSHQNPAIKELYSTFFEKPNSHKAHQILHTTYVKRDKY